MKNTHESFEPVSASGSEKPWEALDSEPVERPKANLAPPEEQSPVTERSSEHPTIPAPPGSLPESAPQEGGEPVVQGRISVLPDLGAADRRGEPVSGDRAKAPFASSVIAEEDDEQQAAA